MPFNLIKPSNFATYLVYRTVTGDNYDHTLYQTYLEQVMIRMTDAFTAKFNCNRTLRSTDVKFSTRPIKDSEFFDDRFELYFNPLFFDYTVVTVVSSENLLSSEGWMWHAINPKYYQAALSSTPHLNIAQPVYFCSFMKQISGQRSDLIGHNCSHKWASRSYENNTVYWKTVDLLALIERFYGVTI